MDWGCIWDLNTYIPLAWDTFIYQCERKHDLSHIEGAPLLSWCPLTCHIIIMNFKYLYSSQCPYILTVTATCWLGKTQCRCKAACIDVHEVTAFHVVGPQVPCLCSSATCLMCSCCPSSRNSTVTRIIYAFVLLLGTIVSCVMLSPGVDEQLRRVWRLIYLFNSSGPPQIFWYIRLRNQNKILEKLESVNVFHFC